MPLRHAKKCFSQNETSGNKETLWIVTVTENEEQPLDVDMQGNDKGTRYYIVQILDKYFPVFQQENKNLLLQRNWRNNNRLEGVEATQYFANMVGCDQDGLSSNPRIFNFSKNIIRGIFVHVRGDHWDLYVPVDDDLQFTDNAERSMNNKFVRIKVAGNGGCALNCLSFFVVSNEARAEAIRTKKIAAGEMVYDQIRNNFRAEPTFPQTWELFKERWGTGNWTTPDLYYTNLDLNTRHFLIFDLEDDPDIRQKQNTTGYFQWPDIYNQFLEKNGSALFSSQQNPTDAPKIIPPANAAEILFTIYNSLYDENAMTLNDYKQKFAASLIEQGQISNVYDLNDINLNDINLDEIDLEVRQKQQTSWVKHIKTRA